MLAVVVPLVVQYRIGCFDLHGDAQGALSHLRRQRPVQRLKYPFAQRGLLFGVAAVAYAQHHMDKGVVGVTIDDQAIVHAQRAGARAGKREQAAVADGGVLHGPHQCPCIQVQVARVLNPDVGHGPLRRKWLAR
ncbi:hypothetical protein D3C71_1331810 [compost metagenome]